MRTHTGQNQLQYMTFEAFDKTNAVKHAFSTRIGGLSSGIYESLNLRLNHHDNRETVIQNYERLADAIGVSLADMVLAWQVHDTRIHDAVYADRGKGIMRESDIQNVDALATSDKDVVLVAFFADCVPLYYLDPVNQVIALAHAGWRGTVAGMAEKMVVHLQKKYGCDPKNMLVGIGPCIGPCCFETGQEVAAAFENAFSDAGAFIKPLQNGKVRIDLQGINREMNKRAGILPEHISVANECTMCNGKQFFSHRVMGNERGTMAAFLQLSV